jgi:NhaA family Na+:H+ antiporter
MPLFALANAGVTLSMANFDRSLATAVFSGFALGKPLGVFLFSVLAVRLRLAARPAELTWGLLAAGGLLTGIGFTMALFIAELAFGPGLLNSAKLGILASSGFAGISGLIALRWLTSRKTGVNGTAPPRLLAPDAG